MKLVPLVLAAALQIFLFVALMNFGSEPTQTELEELNRIASQRDDRRQLVEYLLAEEIVGEAPNGTLQVNGEISPHAQDAVIEENLNRKRLFELLAQQQDRTAESVGREFFTRQMKRFESKGLELTPAELPEGKPLVATLSKQPLQAPVTPVVSTANRAEPIGLPLHRTETEILVQGDAAIVQHVLPDLVAGYLKAENATEIVPMLDSKGRSLVNYTSAKNRPEAIVLTPADSTDASSDFRLVDVDLLSPIVDQIDEETTVTQAPAIPEGPVAHDALVVVVHPQNPLAKISTAELASVFSGQVKFWNSLVDGDARGMIHPACNTSESPSFRYLNQRVLAPVEREISDYEAVTRGSDRDVARKVAGDSNAIGIVAFSSVPPELDVKVVRVSRTKGAAAIYPSLYSVRYGSYPLARKFVLEANGEPSGIAVDLADYAKTSQGQDALNNFLLLTGDLLDVDDAPENDPAKKALSDALEVRRLKALESGFAPADYLGLINKATRDRSPEDLYFAAATEENGLQITMDETSQMELLKIVDRLALMGDPEASVHLIGFSDSTGSEDYNLKLSKSRARLAADFLKQFGIANVTSYGFGETLPIADNDSEIGRNRNRRVEVWVSSEHNSLVTMRD